MDIERELVEAGNVAEVVAGPLDAMPRWDVDDELVGDEAAGGCVLSDNGDFVSDEDMEDVPSCSETEPEVENVGSVSRLP